MGLKVLFLFIAQELSRFSRVRINEPYRLTLQRVHKLRNGRGWVLVFMPSAVVILPVLAAQVGV